LNAARDYPTKEYQLSEESKLKEPEPKLKTAITRYFKFQGKPKIKTAIVGAPRITGVGTPKFYIWLLAGDKEGAARLAIMDDEVEMLDFISKAEMKKNSSLLNSKFPRDAVVLIKTFLE